jgi:hypothetical protein
MSISGISSTNVYQSSLQTRLQQLKSDFTDLEKSLNSGDLAVAQKAFAALQQDMQNVGQQTGGNNQLTNDLVALGNDLQSGDLTGAQKAFATLMQDMESGSAQNTTATSTSDSTAANPQSIGSIINLTT